MAGVAFGVFDGGGGSLWVLLGFSGAPQAFLDRVVTLCFMQEAVMPSPIMIGITSLARQSSIHTLSV